LGGALFGYYVYTPAPEVPQLFVLAGRRSVYVIILLASLPLMGVPLIHMRGAGVGFGTRI
jgi:hypothetical protein